MMEAIPTMYKGVQFRSKLEAKWATFFDRLNIRWTYEPEGFTNGKINYLPDFWLPECHHRGKLEGVYFEVKPDSDSQSQETIDKAWMLAEGSSKAVIIPVSTRDSYVLLEEYVFDGVRTYDYGLEFALCDGCGAADIGFYSGDEPGCSCGRGRFHTSHATIKQAVSEFPNYARWHPTSAIGVL